MITDQVLTTCRETEADPNTLAGLTKRLEALGFAHTWASCQGGETLWTHPMAKAHNDKHAFGAGILNHYFCDIRHDGHTLWYTIGRLGNTANFKLDLPEAEHKTCPECGGRAYHGFLRYDSKLVLKPGNKRRTRQRFEVKGWQCMGKSTDLDVSGCGWQEEKQ